MSANFLLLSFKATVQSRLIMIQNTLFLNSQRGCSHHKCTQCTTILLFLSLSLSDASNAMLLHNDSNGKWFAPILGDVRP